MSVVGVVKLGNVFGGYKGGGGVFEVEGVGGMGWVDY